MRIIPNIGKPMRVGYVVVGAALIAAPFAVAMEQWQRVALPILGAVAVVTGAVGW
ncbi:MAG: hypothetical protein IID37_16485 [Planctomycetes bacterium]|nr:hypothetical protein [Planctomycetota bacterium]